MAGGHKDRAHALLSPSSAKRWMNCTPSAVLESQLESTTSEAAEEGTLCHELCEGKLRRKFSPDAYSSRKLTYLRKKCMENPLWNDEMERTSDIYVDKIYEDALGFSEMPLVLPEEQLDLSDWIPEGFGTSDCTLIGDDRLNIYDYKHGKGVPVDAYKNEQMMAYALGAYKKFGWMAEIKYIKMCIIQPRLNSITEYEVTLEELLNWGRDHLKPAAEKAYKGEGSCKAGDWCKFCRAKGQCRARAEEAFQVEESIGLIPPFITAEEAGKMIEIGRRVAEWLKDLEAWALGQVVNGFDVPGWKAVEGRSRRAITDFDAVCKILVENDVPKSKLYKTSPISLTEAEELVGKKVFAELCGSYVVKPQGKPTLVPESDARPAITNKTSVEEAFGDLLGGNLA